MKPPPSHVQFHIVTFQLFGRGQPKFARNTGFLLTTRAVVPSYPQVHRKRLQIYIEMMWGSHTLTQFEDGKRIGDKTLKHMSRNTVKQELVYFHKLLVHANYSISNKQ